MQGSECLLGYQVLPAWFRQTTLESLGSLRTSTRMGHKRPPKGTALVYALELGALARRKHLPGLLAALLFFMRSTTNDWPLPELLKRSVLVQLLQLPTTESAEKKKDILGKSLAASTHLHGQHLLGVVERAADLQHLIP